MSALIVGSALTDPVWLDQRVTEVGRPFGRPERRVAATFWWYSTSLVLLDPAVRALARTGAGLDLAAATVRLSPIGYLEAVRPGPALAPGLTVFARHLETVLAAVIEPLARVGEARPRTLWAIAADAVASCALAACPAGDRAQAPVASQLTAPALATAVARATSLLRPLPRYEDVSGPAGGPPQRYVRRGSCCLLYQVGAPLCLSCPRQPPAERHARLARHAEGAQ